MSLIIALLFVIDLLLFVFCIVGFTLLIRDFLLDIGLYLLLPNFIIFKSKKCIICNGIKKVTNPNIYFDSLNNTYYEPRTCIKNCPNCMNGKNYTLRNYFKNTLDLNHKIVLYNILFKKNGEHRVI